MSVIQVCRCGKPARFGKRCEDCYADDISGQDKHAYDNLSKPIRDMPKKEVLALPISELGLEIKVANCLFNLGIRLIGDLVLKTQKELLKSERIGASAIDDIND